MNLHKKKTRHKGDESTVGFWLYMGALYKEEQNDERYELDRYSRIGGRIGR